MKQGKTLQDMAIELDRQSQMKRDFIVDTRQAQVLVADPHEEQRENARKLELALPINGGAERFPINKHAMYQVGARLKIPQKYVQRLEQDHPDMLAYNINGLFSREPEKRMVRTLDGNARAFLSDRYRVMDNFDLAQAVLPTLMKHGAQVTSCDVTESKMYIKAVKPDLIEELGPPPGHAMGDGTHTFFIDKVQAGICLSNSEIGAGKLHVQPASFTERCTNYAVFSSTNYGKVHLGRKQGGDMEQMAWEVFSDDTKQKSDEALFSQVKDLVTASMDGTIFKRMIEDLKAARGEKIEGNIQKVVEVVQKKFSLSNEETGGCLEHLIKGGELSKYGLHAAVTRLSQDIEDYDRASELEALGGQIIELPKRDWQEIAKAA